MKFKKNVGFIDAIIRTLLIIDLLILPLFDFVPAGVSYLLIALSGWLAISCVTGYCWIYNFLNITTRFEPDL